MKSKFIFHLLITILAFACTKEKKYQYEVNPVNVGGNASDKSNRKTTTEFISIAYSDLFNSAIPQSKLINLSVAYSSFGDLKIIEERIIKNFLNDTSVVIPTTVTVNGDTTLFIVSCYKKFFNREPGTFEKHLWKETIRTNTSVSPSIIYYAMMTSDEYRFY